VERFARIILGYHGAKAGDAAEYAKTFCWVKSALRTGSQARMNMIGWDTGFISGNILPNGLAVGLASMELSLAR
jgi:hypothetical protein